MRNTLETRVGLFVVLALFAAFLILHTVGALDVFKRGYRLYALFNSVQELTVRAPVKMAGVPIGRVEDIGFEENKVKVAMKLNRKAVVKTDSKATIKFTGLMGQNFVSIDFGSPGAHRLDDNQYVTTAEQPDFSALVAKLDDVATGVDNLTKSFTGDKIDNLLGPMMDFFKQNREPLSDSVANLKSISAQIAEGKGTVGKLIREDTLYNSALATVTNLQETAAEARLAIADARRIVSQVNAGEGTVGKLVKDETLYRETTASMTNLKEILQKINQGQGTAGKFVNDDSFYKNAKLSLQKLDKATEGLEDQGPLSVLGIAVNHLF
jgi:phospholipid/cholesterol/gamma-HCH transport system substrate-binding protein